MPKISTLIGDTLLFANNAMQRFNVAEEHQKIAFSTKPLEEAGCVAALATNFYSSSAYGKRNIGLT